MNTSVGTPERRPRDPPLRHDRVHTSDQLGVEHVEVLRLQRL